ncbi:hypothetical protein NY40_1001 [Helicobacter pylori NY40]|uniref:Uncharacterized protein n=1 Tax=Helicobacter pylori NY40 TaxID=1426844 RepID=A0A060PTP8_HELPX|nr:hypothetical protein NY40_1001 [Helicobacter pylori NY40]
MYSIGTRIWECSSFKSLPNRCVKLSMPFWITSCILSKTQYSLAEKEQDERMLVKSVAYFA